MNYEILREANAARQAEWDPSGYANSPAWRLNELGGEVGEVCNLLKKLHRERMGVPGSRATKDQLAEELADVMICIDLAAMEFGVEWRLLNAHAASNYNSLPALPTLPRQGTRLLAYKGNACLAYQMTAPMLPELALLQAATMHLAFWENIDLRMATAAKFNATSAKVGLQTTLRLDPEDMDYGDGRTRY